MDTTLLLLCCGVLVGFSGARTSSPNPECADLVALKKHVENSIKVYPGASLHCNPNKNCSGLSCNGKINKKSFKGTVILQGCQEPVTLLVHFGDRQLVLKNNQKTKVLSYLQVETRLKKSGDSVYVTVILHPCVLGKCGGPLKYNILNNQKIRVRCNGSNIKYLTTQRPLASAEKPNPECKGLSNMKKTVEQHFNQIGGILFSGSKISCEPNPNCSELHCTGIADKDHFNATATIEYCSTPIRLRLKVDVPNKKLHFDHDFEDGQEVEIMEKPRVTVTVHLKRIENVVYVTVSVSLLVFPAYNLVKNMSITVDPSHCPGYHGPAGEHRRCKGLLTMGKSIENRMAEIGDPKETFATCYADKQCNELHCHGKFDNDEFHSVASLGYCDSTTILHMHIVEGNNTYIHSFKDGDTFKMPYPITVGLKRTGNDIAVNLSISNQFLVQNVIISVDPNYCSKPGTAPAEEHRQCKGLLTMGKSIENRLAKIGDPKETFATCNADKQCNELHCHGKFDNDEFHSVASLGYCDSTTILHMHILEGNNTYIHSFKDGDTFKMPYPITVGLKRTGNDIAVNLSISNQFLVQNVIISVDPNYCSKPGTGKSKSLSGAATAVIALAAIIILALLAGLIIWLRKSKRFSLTGRPARYNDLVMSDDTNPLYDEFEPAMA